MVKAKKKKYRVVYERGSAYPAVRALRLSFKVRRKGTIKALSDDQALTLAILRVPRGSDTSPFKIVRLFEVVERDVQI